MCFKQAKALYDSQEFKYELLQGVFLQSEICIEEQIITSGWRVVPKKTPIVGYVSLYKLLVIVHIAEKCINNLVCPTIKYKIFFIS